MGIPTNNLIYTESYIMATSDMEVYMEYQEIQSASKTSYNKCSI